MEWATLLVVQFQKLTGSKSVQKFTGSKSVQSSMIDMSIYDATIVQLNLIGLWIT